MKKFFAILAVLSFLMIPMASMAAMNQITDNDMAAITGQSGVTIDVSTLSIGLSIGTITWGDYDGFTGYANAGFVNVGVYQFPMNVVITGLGLTIDVGTSTAGTTAIAIGVKAGGKITADAFIADINLNSSNGAGTDYLNANYPALAASSYTANTKGNLYVAYLKALAGGGTGATELAAYAAASSANTLGVFGISGIGVKINSDSTILISAH